MHRSAFTRISETLAGPQSEKMPKHSQVRVYGIMPKTRRSAVTENGKNSQVRGHGNCEKLTGLWSRKYAKKLPGLQSPKMKKKHRSAFKQKCKKLAGPRSRKMPKTRRSAVTENGKNSQVRGDGKYQKVAGPRLQKNAKNSQVHGHKNMPNNF